MCLPSETCCWPQLLNFCSLETDKQNERNWKMGNVGEAQTIIQKGDAMPMPNVLHTSSQERHCPWHSCSSPWVSILEFTLITHIQPTSSFSAPWFCPQDAWSTFHNPSSPPPHCLFILSFPNHRILSIGPTPALGDQRLNGNIHCC